MEVIPSSLEGSVMDTLQQAVGEGIVNAIANKYNPACVFFLTTTLVSLLGVLFIVVTSPEDTYVLWAYAVTFSVLKVLVAIAIVAYTSTRFTTRALVKKLLNDLQSQIHKASHQHEHFKKYRVLCERSDKLFERETTRCAEAINESTRKVEHAGIVDKMRSPKHKVKGVEYLAEITDRHAGAEISDPHTFDVRFDDGAKDILNVAKKDLQFTTTKKLELALEDKVKIDEKDFKRGDKVMVTHTDPDITLQQHLAGVPEFECYKKDILDAADGNVYHTIVKLHSGAFQKERGERVEDLAKDLEKINKQIISLNYASPSTPPPENTDSTPPGSRCIAWMSAMINNRFTPILDRDGSAGTEPSGSGSNIPAATEVTEQLTEMKKQKYEITKRIEQMSEITFQWNSAGPDPQYQHLSVPLNENWGWKYFLHSLQGSKKAEFTEAFTGEFKTRGTERIYDEVILQPQRRLKALSTIVNQLSYEELTWEEIVSHHHRDQRGEGVNHATDGDNRFLKDVDKECRSKKPDIYFIRSALFYVFIVVLANGLWVFDTIHEEKKINAAAKRDRLVAVAMLGFCLSVFLLLLHAIVLDNPISKKVENLNESAAKHLVISVESEMIDKEKKLKCANESMLQGINGAAEALILLVQSHHFILYLQSWDPHILINMGEKKETRGNVMQQFNKKEQDLVEGKWKPVSRAPPVSRVPGEIAIDVSDENGASSSSSVENTTTHAPAVNTCLQ
jgi:hypothetical protein